jgi:hypothetical protein
MSGPSWTAPTVPLLPVGRRRAGRGRAAAAPHGPDDATTELPAVTDDTAGLGAVGLGAVGLGAAEIDAAGVGAAEAGAAEVAPGPRTAGSWLRDHGWVVAVAGVAAIVLVCARVVIDEPEPAWVGAGPVAAPPATTAAPATTPPATTAAPTVKPTRSARPSRPPRRPPARPRATRPAPAPVLAGPGSDLELWLLVRRYCADVYDAEPRMTGFGPGDGWECRSGRDRTPVDRTALCRYAYGSKAFAGDGNGSLSWRCYRRG